MAWSHAHTEDPFNDVWSCDIRDDAQPLAGCGLPMRANGAGTVAVICVPRCSTNDVARARGRWNRWVEGPA